MTCCSKNAAITLENFQLGKLEEASKTDRVLGASGEQSLNNQSSSGGRYNMRSCNVNEFEKNNIFSELEKLC